jgi:surface protein
MIKAIRYETTGSANNSRRKGNFLLGEFIVPYGPTSTTGFYSSVVPPEGGYTIYTFKESLPGNLSYFSASSDSDLISYVNKASGQSYTTPFQAIDWINEQSNYFVDPNYFEFTVKTDNIGVSTSTQFKLPLVPSGTVNFLVDWGDNTTSTVTSWDQAETTHTYSSAGTYTIKIVGQLRGWKFGNLGDRLKMLNISSWGALDISVDGAFFGCQNMTCSAVDSPVISGTNLSNTFRSCSNFNGPIGNWNVSNVTDMRNMFDSAIKFNQDIGLWNTSKVTNMASMFQSASLFNQDISSWDTSLVTSMSFMFYATDVFNQNIGSWNTEKVTSMSFMFLASFGFNGEIGTWNTSSVTDMQQMFSGATSFNKNIGNWDVSKVKNMSSMFLDAFVFNQDIGSWNTSEVTNMSTMFRRARDFDQNIGSWNVSKVTNFSNFMAQKTNLNFSAENLDAIYNGWSSRTVLASRSISFGTIKYTSSGATGRSILTSAPNTWSIADGGQQ